MHDARKVDFDRYADDYDDLLARDTGFFANADYFAEYKVALTARLVPRQIARLHEFGCGTGRNLPLLRKHFPSSRIWASDISRRSLELAAVNCRDAILWQEGVESPGAPCDEQDLVFVAGVFHHVAPDQRSSVMDRLASRLGPHGHLVVFEHNPYNPVTRRIVGRCPFDADAILLKPGELQSLGTRAGLTHLRTDYTLFFPRLLDIARAMERYLRRVPLGGQYVTVFRKDQSGRTN